MIYEIQNEQHFQVLSDSFSVSPSESGYVLMFSANGFDFSPFTTVAPGQNKQFVSMSNGNYYYLSGNTDTVQVNWERECHGGGGGGTAGVSSLDGQTGALTTKTINGNAILGSGDIVITGGTGSEVSYSQTLTAGTEIGQITIDGSATTIYAPEGGSDESDVRFITDDSGMTWETHYDENGNIDWRKQVTDDYNAIKEIYHRDYVTYTFTHTGSTWGGTNPTVLTVSNGGNSRNISIQDGQYNSNAVNISGVDFAFANVTEYNYSTEETAFFARLNNDGSVFKTYHQQFPDFYAKLVGGSSNDCTWTFACPSSYTVTVSSITADGWEYVGSGTTDFVETAPAGPILLYQE